MKKWIVAAACMMLLVQQTLPVFGMPESAVDREAAQIIVPSASSSEERDGSEAQQEALEEAEEIAYLDLESASPEMKEKILSARNRIIFSQCWVADGFTLELCDEKGNVIGAAPNFSELFPGWDLPVDESIVNGDFDMTSIPYFDGYKWVLPDGEEIRMNNSTVFDYKQTNTAYPVR